VAGDEVSSFGGQKAEHLGSVLGDGLVGVYFVGSAALGGYVPGQSDLDVVAVCEKPIPPGRRPQMAEKVFALTADCPARGLEFTLYRREAAGSDSTAAAFELNVNGGRAMDRSVHLDQSVEPGFWYVIDRAIAHRRGVVISGPSPESVFADVPRLVLVSAMAESMSWHRQHEGATLYSVLNAAGPGDSEPRASWARSSRAPNGAGAAGPIRGSSTPPSISATAGPRSWTRPR